MVIGMFLAHLVGDYVLQWDSLARWKSREVKGAIFHGLIVLLVTWMFALRFDPNWWPWAVFIGLTFVVLGQFALIPVVAVPRLVFEGRQVIGTTRAKLYVAELLASVALAVAIGLGLRYV